MDNKTRAEKIVNKFLAPWAEMYKTRVEWITSQLDEAILFAIEEDRKLWDAQHALDLKLHVEQAVRKAEEKVSRVLDFAKGAIEDAIYNEDGLDGDTGQSVVKMIEEAKKGLAEGCQHCDLQFDRGFAAAREKAAGIALEHPCLNQWQTRQIAERIRKMEA